MNFASYKTYALHYSLKVNGNHQCKYLIIDQSYQSYLVLGFLKVSKQ
jgi:hypothetical protein